MILPITAYGSPVLKKKCTPIDASYPELSKLIADMWETMYNANGVGLAAPQIGRDIRLFIVDATAFYEPAEEGKQKRYENNEIYPEAKDFKRVFINAEVIDENGEEWPFEEGCLSIPNIRENVKRHSVLKLKYQDELFNTHEEVFEGIVARVIQHEYDHIEGILFTDYLNPLKKRALKRKLEKIAKGEISVDYKMSFPLLKRR